MHGAILPLLQYVLMALRLIKYGVILS